MLIVATSYRQTIQAYPQGGGSYRVSQENLGTMAGLAAFLGDRLVFSNGIFALSGFAALLLIVFQGSVSRLIPLYAVGVFISFTLSQSGMVVHW